ncbi:palmitoyltransferase, partial [Hamiltosporidium tvaerminnensis]
MGWREVKQDAIGFIAYAIYPVIIIYSYFVVVGIFCLEDKRFENAYIIMTFIIYHFLALYTGIFYMRLLSNDEVSTLSLFPHMRRSESENIIDDINPFFIQEISKKRLRDIQTCNICKTYKPPRAHHCKKCKKCFLKMDHHCYLVDSCIAFHNYKFFYLFLVFNSIFMLYVILTLVFPIFMDDYTSSTTNYIIIVLLFSIGWIITMFFLVLHTKLISFNETTIEYETLEEYLAKEPFNPGVFQEGPLV